MAANLNQPIMIIKATGLVYTKVHMHVSAFVIAHALDSTLCIAVMFNTGTVYFIIALQQLHLTAWT